MLKLTKIQLIKIIIIYIMLALIAVCCYNINKLLGPPRKRPFECYDMGLRKPFVTDTVPPKQLYILGVYLPMLLIAICELISNFTNRKSLQMLKYVLKVSVLLTLFLIGLAIERLIKNVIKIKMARLRPHFITVCNPINTNGLECWELEYMYIMDEYECSAGSYPDWAINTTFLSFPSGHTSLISYSMIFLICYLHLRFLEWRNMKSSSNLGILIMQISCFFMIVYVVTSRILDFKHHWSDVCAGFIGGSSIAILLIFYLKSQLENIETWLKEVACDISADDETSKIPNTTASENVKKPEETCVIELIAE